jgi:hypothetical protein
MNERNPPFGLGEEEVGDDQEIDEDADVHDVVPEPDRLEREKLRTSTGYARLSGVQAIS